MNFVITYLCRNAFIINYKLTCSSVSDDKEEGVIGHDLWVQHQSPGQGNHS